jgi:hypothetical protein
MCPCVLPKPTMTGTLTDGGNSSTGTLTYASNPYTGYPAWTGTLTGTAGSWYAAVALDPFNGNWEYCFFRCIGGPFYDVYSYTCPSIGANDYYAAIAVPFLCGFGVTTPSIADQLTLSGASTCSPLNLIFTSAPYTLTFTP